MSTTNTGASRAITGTARAQLPTPQSGGPATTHVQLTYRIDGVAFKVQHVLKSNANLAVGAVFTVHHVVNRDGAEVIVKREYATRAMLTVRTLKGDGSDSARVEGYTCVALSGTGYISKTRNAAGGRDVTAVVEDAYVIWVPREAIQSVSDRVITYPKAATVVVKRLTMFDK